MENLIMCWGSWTETSVMQRSTSEGACMEYDLPGRSPNRHLLIINLRINHVDPWLSELPSIHAETGFLTAKTLSPLPSLRDQGLTSRSSSSPNLTWRVSSAAFGAMAATVEAPLPSVRADFFITCFEGGFSCTHRLFLCLHLLTMSLSDLTY